MKKKRVRAKCRVDERFTTQSKLSYLNGIQLEPAGHLEMQRYLYLLETFVHAYARDLSCHHCKFSELYVIDQKMYK